MSICRILAIELQWTYAGSNLEIAESVMGTWEFVSSFLRFWEATYTFIIGKVFRLLCILRKISQDWERQGHFSVGNDILNRW